MDLSHLNPPQRAAVEHVSGPQLVLAGAGSGKTRVITYRIAHLLGKGVPPQKIAALTFTNKAAREMRERVAHLVGDAKVASKLTVSTFHSLGLKILRQEARALGYPRGFVIFDTSDQMGTIRELLRAININDRRFDVKAILSRISLAKNAFIAPEDYSGDDADEYDEVTAEIYPRYQAALRAFAAVDFDDLITETVRLIDRDDEVRIRWQGMYGQVLVDEYQDTNRAQLMMLRHMVALHQNLCVVGDDDQSIYSWRGADHRNILGFERMFNGANVIKLEQNYRSTPTILDAANAVIANNSERHGKKLWSDRGRGDKVISVIAPENSVEAQFVAREIQELRHDGRRFSDFAVLYRSNLQAQLLEEELRMAEVPYVLFGGQQFFERKEVKDVIAYMRVALNPRDEISLRRIINYPARGIGPTSLEKLAKRAIQKPCSLYDALPLWESIGVQTRVGRGITNFCLLIDALRDKLQSGEPVVATARWLIEKIDLVEDLRSAAPNFKAAQRRLDNVEALFRSLERHAQRGGGLKELADFLQHLALDNSDDDKPEDAGDRVVLTTLHGAKGLEFPVVFLVGMEEELLPHHRTLRPVASDAADLDHAADVSEERRLAYVGITRAQQLLYLTRSQTRLMRGKRVERVPSRFLLEIPEELVVERDLGEEGLQSVDLDELGDFFSQLAK